MPRGLILSVGARSDLLATRNLVLETRGYLVVAAHNADEALELVRNTEFDVAILCHTIPAKERERLILALKRAKPLTTVLTIEAGGFIGRPEFADDSVAGIDGPDVLFSHIEEALSRHRAFGSHQ